MNHVGFVDLLLVRLSNVTFSISQLPLSETHFSEHKNSYYYPALRVFGREAAVARGPATTAGSPRCLFSSKQRGLELNRSSLDGEVLRQQTQPISLGGTSTSRYRSYNKKM